MRRLQRGDTHAPVSFGYEQLHAFLGGITQFAKRFVRSAGERERLGRRPTQCDQTGAQREATLVITTNQTMFLECGGQSMGSGPGQPGGIDKFGERTRLDLKNVEDQNRLVQHADTA